MSSEKRSISAPGSLFAKADVRKEQLGYSTFSDYIQALLRADSLGGGDHLREAAPTPDSPSTPPVPSAETDTTYHKRKKRRK